MPWLRSGDNAATYPALLAVAMTEGADDRTLNEVRGWLQRCAEQSAGHLTDGVIDAGTAYLMGGSRTPALVAAAIETGLLTEVPGSRPQAWQIIDDPEFLHIRSRASVEFDRQRDRDRKNPELTAPVRLRDGDACRYCGQVVNFRARTGGRAGTYDHTDPGQPATVATYVVCCKGCNSKMKDGERLELLPAPAPPFFHPATLEWLHDHGMKPPAGYRSDPARPDQGLTPGGHRAPARPARGAATAAAPDPARPRDPGEQDHNPWEQLPDDEPPQAPPGRNDQDRPGNVTGFPVRDGTGRDGPGRDGQGRGGPGRGGAGVSPPAGGGGRSGRRRGRRGKGKGGGGR